MTVLHSLLVYLNTKQYAPRPDKNDRHTSRSAPAQVYLQAQVRR
jgi:hypothetical protein